MLPSPIVNDSAGGQMVEPFALATLGESKSVSEEKSKPKIEIHDESLSVSLVRI